MRIQWIASERRQNKYSVDLNPKQMTNNYAQSGFLQIPKDFIEMDELE